jgi:hypothetical protein
MNRPLSIGFVVFNGKDEEEAGSIEPKDEFEIKLHSLWNIIT